MTDVLHFPPKSERMQYTDVIKLHLHILAGDQPKLASHAKGTGLHDGLHDVLHDAASAVCSGASGCTCLPRSAFWGPGTVR